MSKKFVSGLVLGAIAGATAALLLTPKKGEELREEISDKSEDLKAIALDYIELLSVKGEELLNATVQTTQSLVDKFQQDNKNDVENIVEVKAEELADSVEEAVDVVEKEVIEPAEKAIKNNDVVKEVVNN